jgi:hypothetical protein
MGCSSFRSWGRRYQAFIGSYSETQKCSGGRTERDATYGVLPSEEHSTPTISSFQVMDLLRLDRSFSSVYHGPREKDLDKRVRSLTVLTAQMEILACTSTFFDSTHPLPKVCVLQPESVDFPCYFFVLHFAHYSCSSNSLCGTTNF